MNASAKDIEIAERIRQIMVTKGLTLSSAESCTSGRIAATLTSVDGASNYFQGGIIAYQNQLKERFLNVSTDTIDIYDVVSKEVVTEMVKGCCKLFDTNFAISSTGYTGTGSDKVAAGTVWIGIGTADSVKTFCLTNNDGRETNTASATSTAIAEFYKYINSL